MNLTIEGLALIKHFEGFRAVAYRDPVGILTIGYGHTSAAGPPAVLAGQKITEEQATQLLATDVEKFAEVVRKAVKRPLNDQQFSALVSFTYNVGPASFLRSGVLRAVDAGDFDAVPRRFNLWIKAGGRVLPGLVRRRAAEGAMFANSPLLAEPTSTGPVDLPVGKPLARSKTIWAAMITVALASLHTVGQPFGLLVLAAISAAAAIIIFERYRKAKEEGL